MCFAVCPLAHKIFYLNSTHADYRFAVSIFPNRCLFVRVMFWNVQWTGSSRTWMTWTPWTCLKEAARLQRARAGKHLLGLESETDQEVSLRERHERPRRSEQSLPQIVSSQITCRDVIRNMKCRQQLFHLKSCVLPSNLFSNKGWTCVLFVQSTSCLHSSVTWGRAQCAATTSVTSRRITSEFGFFTHVSKLKGNFTLSRHQNFVFIKFKGKRYKENLYQSEKIKKIAFIYIY